MRPPLLSSVLSLSLSRFSFLLIFIFLSKPVLFKWKFQYEFFYNKNIPSFNFLDENEKILFPILVLITTNIDITLMVQIYFIDSKKQKSHQPVSERSSYLKHEKEKKSLQDFNQPTNNLWSIPWNGSTEEISHELISSLYRCPAERRRKFIDRNDPRCPGGAAGLVSARFVSPIIGPTGYGRVQ